MNDWEVVLTMHCIRGAQPRKWDKISLGCENDLDTPKRHSYRRDHGAPSREYSAISVPF